MVSNQIATRIAEPTVVGAMTRSEIDGAIATARQYPRDLEGFEHRAGQLATYNEEVAGECTYHLPARGENKEPIEGPSVRFAEILVSSYGNCRVGARIIEEGAEHVVAQGIFHDLETNATTNFETRRRIVDKKGRRYSADMITITCNAACAIALRQAILKGIPKPLWEGIHERAKLRALGDQRSLPQRRDQAIEAFAKLGVEEKHVLASVKAGRREEIDAQKLAELRGTYNAIRDGELSIGEAFPSPASEKAKPEQTTTLEQFGRDNDKPYGTQPKPPDVASAAEAFEIGREARKKHASRTQWPAQWRDQPNIEAWLAGWDAEDEDQKNA